MINVVLCCMSITNLILSVLAWKSISRTLQALDKRMFNIYAVKRQIARVTDNVTSTTNRNINNYQRLRSQMMGVTHQLSRLRRNIQDLNINNAEEVNEVIQDNRVGTSARNNKPSPLSWAS